MYASNSARLPITNEHLRLTCLTSHRSFYEGATQNQHRKDNKGNPRRMHFQRRSFRSHTNPFAAFIAACISGRFVISGTTCM